MKPKRASPPADPQRVPGGRLLAQYVGKLIVAFVSKHVEPDRRRIQLQRDAVVTAKYSVMPLSACRGCAIVLHHSALEICSRDSSHGVYCPDCCIGKLCKRLCCAKCQMPGCATFCPKGEARHQCGQCGATICADHRQFCSHCGVALCLKADATQPCLERHQCTMGQKRAKK